jgi:ribosomal protein L37AE/L43A
LPRVKQAEAKRLMSGARASVYQVRKLNQSMEYNQPEISEFHGFTDQEIIAAAERSYKVINETKKTPPRVKLLRALQKYEDRRKETERRTAELSAQHRPEICPSCHGADVKTYSHGEKECNQCHRTWNVKGMAESGPFSYGFRKPRKGSVAYFTAQKRKQQEQGKKPVEPRNQMVGTAKIIPSVR